MRYFYIAVAETRFLEDIFNVIKAWDEKLQKIRGVRVGILIRFAKWKRGCLPCKLADAYSVPLFVDNGAFEYLSKSDLEERTINASVLERWVREYASWIASWYPYVTAAAMPDVPVHGREFLPADVRLERIVLTNRLHSRFYRLVRAQEPEALRKLVIVIQGFEVHEYQLSASMNLSPDYAETCTLGGGCPYHGIVGVGSVCVRKPSSRGKTALLAEGKAAGTLSAFMREFLNARWPRELRGFHFFGLHTEAVRQYGMHPRYYASDTGAHGLNYKYKWRTVLGCRKLGERECYIRAVESQLRTTLSSLLSLEINRISYLRGRTE